MSSKHQRADCTLNICDSEHLKSLIVTGNQESVAKYLCEKHASVNSGLVYYGERKTFPLHTALDVEHENYHHDLVEYFISEGAGLDVVSYRGYAPLHYAVQHKNMPATRALLRAGANVNLLTFPPLCLLLCCDLFDFRYDRPDFYVPPSDKKYAVAYRKFLFTKPLPVHDFAKVLLSHGANCNAVDRKGRAPLHYAVMKDDFNVVALLLDAGADINICNAEHDRSPPMFSAVSQPMVQYLIARNAKLENPNTEGENILYVLIASGFFNIARYLIVEFPVLLRRRPEKAPGLKVLPWQEDTLTNAVGRYMCIWHQMHFSKETDADLSKLLEEYEKIFRLLLKTGCDPELSVFKLFSEEFLNIYADGLDFLKTMEEMASNSRPLQDLCIIRIRSILHRNVTSAVGSLSLPTRLKEALTMVGTTQFTSMMTSLTRYKLSRKNRLSKKILSTTYLR